MEKNKPEKEKYTSQPRQVYAEQWLGTDIDEMVAFIMPDCRAIGVEYAPESTILKAHTSTGLLAANVTDWICCAVKSGQWFVMTDEEFQAEFNTPGPPNNYQ